MPGSAPERTSPPAGAVAGLLLALLAASLVLRSWFAQDVLPATGRMQGETTQALRYSRMISEGVPVPAVDRMVMYPEGMVTGQNSIFEEYVAGGLHRLAGGDFDGFMRLFCLAFPLLAVPGLFLWMRAAGAGFRPSLLGAQIYGFLLPAMLRARGESLYRETVAVPLLVFCCAAFEGSGRARTGLRAVLLSAAGGLLLFASLAAWKVSSFLSALILFYLLVRRCRGTLHWSAAVAGGLAQIAASLLLPHMRSDAAILSPASAVAAALLLSSAARLKELPLIALLGAATAALLWSPPTTAHVTSLILAKLRFLFTHPADPTLLDPHARLFWVAGYSTPSPGEVILLFGLPLTAALFGARRFWSRGDTLLRWLLPVGLAGYLFMDRLHVLLALGIVPALVYASHTGWKPVALCLALGLGAALSPRIGSLLSGAGLEVSSRPSLLSEQELDSFLEWERNETSPDDAVLCYWHISGLVSAYADRPVVTHTFFENQRNRQTIIEFARRLWMPEDSLVAFMRSVRCRLVVYQADFMLDRSTSGVLYLAGLREPPESCAAVEMQYRPEELDSLELLFQGPSLRVYGLSADRSVSGACGVLFDPRFTGVFDDYEKALAAVTDPVGTAVQLARVGRANRVPDLLSASLSLLAGSGADADAGTGVLQELARLHLEGLYPVEKLAVDFEAYLAAWGPDPDLRTDLALLLEQAGRVEEAAMQYRTALEEAPWLTRASEGLARTGGGT